jgi:hypothetical protein
MPPIRVLFPNICMLLHWNGTSLFPFTVLGVLHINAFDISLLRLWYLSEFQSHEMNLYEQRVNCEGQLKRSVDVIHLSEQLIDKFVLNIRVRQRWRPNSKPIDLLFVILWTFTIVKWVVSIATDSVAILTWFIIDWIHLTLTYVDFF